jgi:predicted nucleotide-binding protein (sugar kinase/HSP70/actin superfamily)
MVRVPQAKERRFLPSPAVDTYQREEDCMKVIIPRMADGSVRLLVAAFRAVGIEAESTPPSDSRTLELGARYTSGDECFPAKVTIGDFMKLLEERKSDLAESMLFMPLADGPCRYGQYAPYLRSILDKHGYRQVRILSPNCDDGYADLGALARPFMRTAWRAAIVGDILTKILLMTRPYETIYGLTDKIYCASVEKLAAVIEAAPLSPRSQLRTICDELRACQNRFAAIPVDHRESKPLIGIVGEIFCRMNSFSNQNVIQKLEEYGAEVWPAGFGEWVWYANTEELRFLQLRGQRWSLRFWNARLRCYIQRRDENALLEPFLADFRCRPDPHIEEILSAAQPYLPPDGAIGEMVLNVGTVPCLARRNIDGVIDIGPFTCMNSIVCEALYPRISRDLGGLPVRSLYFDGMPVDLGMELGIFMEISRAHKRRRTKDRN